MPAFDHPSSIKQSQRRYTGINQVGDRTHTLAMKEEKL
jgi:hypothetical protein